MLTIPIQPVPSQIVRSVVDQQSGHDQQLAVITLRQMRTGLYMNLQLGIKQIVGLVLCEQMNGIVRSSYFGFKGDFFFLDTSGAQADPYFDGLGSRWKLLYFTDADLNFVRFVSAPVAP